MDIVPFYYQNGQLEALSSAHQWLKQSEMAGTACPIWSSGLSEAIARERFAREATPLAANGGGTSSRPIGHLASEVGMPTTTAAATGGMLLANHHHHFWQQRQHQMLQQQQQQIRHTVKSNIVSKINNRRRKAAIIARCAGGSVGEGIFVPIGSALAAAANANGTAGAVPSPLGGVILPPAAVGISASSSFAPKRPSRRTPTTASRTATTAITAAEGASPNPRGTTTDGSESDEDSDVEVFELDEQDMGNDDLFDGTMDSLEERKHKDDDPKVAQWRESFEKAITERYRNKCRRRNMLCRRMLEFNLQRLKATESIELSQLLLTDLRIREKYAMSTDPATEQPLLVHRESGRVFICLEEMFDVLSKFHTDNGHGSSRKAMYVEARKRFANVSKEIVREFLKGCDQCAAGRDGNGWGGRRVKGTGRGAAVRTARGTESWTTDIVGGLALRQYMERMEQQNKQEQQQQQHI